MWIRFWSDSEKRDPVIDKDDIFIWYERDSPDESLQDYARELVPNWMEGLERGFHYGFERLTHLPEDIRVKLVNKYTNQIMHANDMLVILRDDQ
jgi:hypothetical protein